MVVPCWDGISCDEEDSRGCAISGCKCIHNAYSFEVLGQNVFDLTSGECIEHIADDSRSLAVRGRPLHVLLHPLPTGECEKCFDSRLLSRHVPNG